MVCWNDRLNWVPEMDRPERKQTKKQKADERAKRDIEFLLCGVFVGWLVTMAFMGK